MDELCDFENELSSAELLAFCSLRQSGDFTLMSLDGTVMTFSLLFVVFSSAEESFLSTAGVVGCGRAVTYKKKFVK